MRTDSLPPLLPRTVSRLGAHRGEELALSPGPGRSSAILTIPNDEGWELDDPVQVSISMGTPNEIAVDKRNKKQKAS